MIQTLNGEKVVLSGFYPHTCGHCSTKIGDALTIRIGERSYQFAYRDLATLAADLHSLVYNYKKEEKK